MNKTLLKNQRKKIDNQIITRKKNLLMKKTLCVFFTLLLSVVTVNLYGQNEFYVSPSGNDSDPGTIELPWKTVSKAANTLTAGQIAYVKAGTYTGGMSVKNSGTAENYITLMAYPGEQPILDGSGGSYTVVMNLGRQSYIKIAGFKMQNAYMGISGGKSNLIIENNYLYNFTNPGISLSFVTNAVVKGNIADKCCSNSWGECITFNNCEYIDIIGNEVKNGTVNTKGGEGLDVKSSKHMRVYGNLIHGLHKLGLYIDSYDGLNYDIEVFNNLVYDCTDGIVISSEQRNAVDKIWVYNNVVYNSGYSGIAVVNWPTHNDGTLYPVNDILIENNTISTNNAIAIDARNGTNFTIRNNAVFDFNPINFGNKPPSVVVENNISNVGTLSAMGTNSLLTDPLFINASSRDYHLTAASPAIDKGKANKVGFDFDFNVRPVGSNIDMGAFEYGSVDKITIPTRVKPEFTSITSSITSAEDDGVENSATKVVTLTGNTVISKLTTTTNKDIAALRFSSVNLPKGATILNARIQFRNVIQGTGGHGHDPVQIRAERTGNSTPLTTTDGSISSKLKSYTFANWLPESINGEYYTNSLDFIVKEIIARPDWVSGNAMTFIFEVNSTGSLGRFVQFSSFESGSYAPKLIIEYTLNQPNGIETITKSTDELINIYPNPARDMISIDMKGNNFEELSIYNMVGQLVQKEAIELNTNKLDMNIGSLAKGLHIVSLKNKDIAVSRSVIFQ